MAPAWKTAALVLHPHKECRALCEGIRERLDRDGVSLLETAVPVDGPPPDDAAVARLRAADLVFSLGGDGTLLYTARLFHGCAVPVMAVNLGSFGFLTEISREEVYPALDELLAGRHRTEARSMLDVSVRREGREIACYHPLNEVVIGRKEITRLLSLELTVNGRYLCDYRADGLIVSTPTGSTAYSLSANGPILMPWLDSLVVNPICPHVLASRPFILAGDDELVVAFDGPGIAPVLSIDVQVGMELAPGDRVHVRKSAHSLLLVTSPERGFFHVLREKLGWAGSPKKG